jgi:hypothetical protein
MHADAARAPDGDDGVRDLKQEPSAILDSAAVRVVTLVCAVLQELVEQIAVRAVDLDAVEAGRLGVLGPAPIGLDDARNLLGFKGSRRDVSTLRAHQAHVALRRDRARRDRKRAIMIDGVRDPPDMPELEQHAPASRVHALDNLSPALDLFVRPDAGGVRIADPLRRDRCRFGNDEAGGGALHVIFAHERVRNSALASRPVARQRGHENAVWKLEVADSERVEEGGH